MYYYGFDIDKWIKRTHHLMPEEVGIYLLLINYYYDTEKPLPLDVHALSRKLNLSAYKEIVERILEEFFEKTPKGYKNSKCDQIIDEYRVKAEISRKNGAKGGRPRGKNNPEGTQKEPRDNPEGTQRVISGLAKHNPEVTQSEPREKLICKPEKVKDKPPLTPPKKKGGKTRGGKMKIPTPKEIQTYLDEIGETRFTGQEFWDSNETKGWVVGRNKTPMMKWKSAVGTWRSFRNKEDQPEKQFEGFL